VGGFSRVCFFLFLMEKEEVTVGALGFLFAITSQPVNRGLLFLSSSSCVLQAYLDRSLHWAPLPYDV
jgi:hypothetical protein